MGKFVLVKKRLGNRIRVLRISRELSQENMADELKLSTGAYSNIERGVTDLTVTRLYRIAEILHANVIDLLDSTDKIEGILQDTGNKYGEEMERLKAVVEQLQKDMELLKKSTRKK